LNNVVWLEIGLAQLCVTPNHASGIVSAPPVGASGGAR